jgi:L-lactate dehydrogenase complex protein LldG
MSSSPKENILKKIRKALSQPVPLPFPQSEGVSSVYKPPAEDLSVLFAEEFTKLLGRFVYCENYTDLTIKLRELQTQQGWKEIYCVEDEIKAGLVKQGFTEFTKGNLANCDAAITGCEALVARTGSMVMSAAQQSGRTTSVYAPVHICFATVNQLVYDVKDAIQLVKDKYKSNLPSLITFATGPSRTADIEKTLVVGVHGPKQVYCFLLER